MAVICATGCREATLHGAAENGDVGRLESLINKGVDVDAKDESSMTALQLAALKGQKDAVRLLLTNKADPNISAPVLPGAIPSSPLTCAVVIGRKDIVELLLEHGAEVDTESLGAALLQGQADIAALLLPRVGSPNLRDLLSSAVVSGDTNCVSLILNRGAKLNHPDPVTSETVLFLAVTEGHLDVVRLLVFSGADVNVRNTGSRSPLEIARDIEETQIVEFLEAQGAN